MRASLRNLIVTLTMAFAGAGSCGPPTPTSLVPADYRTRFTVVRNCRVTFEHQSPNGVPTTPNITNIIVYVNPESAAAYNANANPLPAGTLVIKEEHSDPDCTHMVAQSISHKEAGFDPDHGDWHWQHVLADRTIDADGRVERCSNNSCHGVAECRARDWMCTQP